MTIDNKNNLTSIIQYRNRALLMFIKNQELKEALLPVLIDLLSSSKPNLVTFPPQVILPLVPFLWHGLCSDSEQAGGSTKSEILHGQALFSRVKNC